MTKAEEDLLRRLVGGLAWLVMTRPDIAVWLVLIMASHDQYVELTAMACTTGGRWHHRALTMTSTRGPGLELMLVALLQIVMRYRRSAPSHFGGIRRRRELQPPHRSVWRSKVLVRNATSRKTGGALCSARVATPARLFRRRAPYSFSCMTNLFVLFFSKIKVIRRQ